MNTDFNIFRVLPSTSNPTNPAPKQTQSAQNKPNLNISLIRLSGEPAKTYSNIPQNHKIKTNPNEPNFKANQSQFWLHMWKYYRQILPTSHRRVYHPKGCAFKAANPIRTQFWSAYAVRFFAKSAKYPSIGFFVDSGGVYRHTITMTTLRGGLSRQNTAFRHMVLLFSGCMRQRSRFLKVISIFQEYMLCQQASLQKVTPLYTR